MPEQRRRGRWAERPACAHGSGVDPAVEGLTSHPHDREQSELCQRLDQLLQEQCFLRARLNTLKKCLPDHTHGPPTTCDGARSATGSCSYGRSSRDQSLGLPQPRQPCWSSSQVDSLTSGDHGHGAQDHAQAAPGPVHEYVVPVGCVLNCGNPECFQCMGLCHFVVPDSEGVHSLPGIPLLPGEMLTFDELGGRCWSNPNPGSRACDLSVSTDGKLALREVVFQGGDHRHSELLTKQVSQGQFLNMDSDAVKDNVFSMKLGITGFELERGTQLVRHRDVGSRIALTELHTVVKSALYAAQRGQVEEMRKNTCGGPDWTSARVKFDDYFYTLGAWSEWVTMLDHRFEDLMLIQSDSERVETYLLLLDYINWTLRYYASEHVFIFEFNPRLFNLIKTTGNSPPLPKKEIQMDHWRDAYINSVRNWTGARRATSGDTTGVSDGADSDGGDGSPNHRLPNALMALCEESPWMWMQSQGFKCRKCLSQDHLQDKCDAGPTALAAARLKTDPMVKKRRRSIADARRKWRAAGCPPKAPFF